MVIHTHSNKQSAKSEVNAAYCKYCITPVVLLKTPTKTHITSKHSRKR